MLWVFIQEAHCRGDNLMNTHNMFFVEEWEKYQYFLTDRKALLCRRQSIYIYAHPPWAGLTAKNGTWQDGFALHAGWISSDYIL